MNVWVGVAVYVVVHVLGVWLLCASGAWGAVFARRGRTPDEPATPGDPLADAPRGWIENHSFWDLATPDGDEEEADFWGVAVGDDG